MTADEIKEFKQKLYAGELSFTYTKVSGQERKARGTMKPELLPLPAQLKDKSQSEQTSEIKADEKKIIQKRSLPVDSILYYDLDAKGFRSFKIANLKSFE